MWIAYSTLILCAAIAGAEAEPVDTVDQAEAFEMTIADKPMGRLSSFQRAVIDLQAAVNDENIPFGYVWPGTRDIDVEIDDEGFVKWMVTERQTKENFGMATCVVTTRSFHLSDLNANSVNMRFDPLSLIVTTYDHERSIRFVRDDRKSRVPTAEGVIGLPLKNRVTEMNTSFAQFEFPDASIAIKISDLLERVIRLAPEYR